jgi:hypothetical protein
VFHPTPRDAGPARAGRRPGENEADPLTQIRAGTVNEHADVIDGLVQLLGDLEVAQSFEAVRNTSTMFVNAPVPGSVRLTVVVCVWPTARDVVMLVGLTFPTAGLLTAKEISPSAWM